MAVQRIAVLGATGRLGRALQLRLADQRLIGLARRPADGVAAQGPTLTLHLGDRRDPRVLAPLLAEADAVVDLCGFDAADAAALLEAAQLAGRRDLALVACSSLAERPWSHWGRAEDLDAPLPDDGYGRDKRRYSQALLDRWPGACLALLLPNLVETAPPDPRLQAWWRQARASGVAEVPGDGDQRPALLTTALAADLIARLLGPPLAARGRLAVAVPAPPTVGELAEALFAAMRPTPRLQRGGPRGLFSAGAEPVALGKLAATLPDYPWPSLSAALRQLGDQLQTSDAERAGGLPPAEHPAR